jgi:hypothetical protein
VRLFAEKHGSLRREVPRPRRVAPFDHRRDELESATPGALRPRARVLETFGGDLRRRLRETGPPAAELAEDFPVARVERSSDEVDLGAQPGCKVKDFRQVARILQRVIRPG